MFGTPRLNGHEIFEITISELQSHFSQGHFSSKDYISYCLERIRLSNPYLEAVIEVNPDAEAIAQSLDGERIAGQVRNPFDLRKSPSGSSSGSAVAVSASLVPLAYGKETP